MFVLKPSFQGPALPAHDSPRLQKDNNAILVPCVNSPVFLSGVISTFDMPVFL